MRAVITGLSPDQSSASAASQREAAIASEVSTGCLLRMTKESGAGIPGTSWAVTAASPGPPAIMGGWRIIGTLVHHQPSRGGNRIPVTSESTAFSQVISCHHRQSGAQTHSGQLSLFVCVCTGLSARPPKRRSPIVSSKSARARAVTMFATQISSGQPSLNSCVEVPIDQITRPAPARRSLRESTKSTSLSRISHRPTEGEGHLDYQSRICVCVNDSQA